MVVYQMWICLILSVLKHSAKAAARCTSIPECKCVVTKNNSMTADCSVLQLTSLPVFNKNVTRINLSHNYISVFPNASELPIHLDFLDLSNNHLSNFSKNSYLRNLAKLKHLDISRNGLNINYNTFPRGLFKGLNELKWINMKSDKSSTFNESQYYPSDTLSDLTSLDTLLIDGMDNAKFGKNYLKLKSLKVLDLSGSTGKCNIYILNSKYFTNLPNLQSIDISYCGLLRIEKDTFRATQYLRYLDISFNEDLTFRVLSNVTYDLQFTQIKVMKAIQLHRTFGTGTELFDEDIKYLKHTPLEELYLDTNRLDVIERNVIEHAPPKLKYISVADNKLTMGYYVLMLCKLSNIKELNGSFQGITHKIMAMADLDQNPQGCDMPCRRPCGADNTFSTRKLSSSKKTYEMNEKISFTIQIPESLEKIHFHKSFLHYTIPKLDFSANNVTFIDFSGNILDKWIGPVTNVKALQYIDLSNNYCSNVSSFFFDNIINLKTLLVRENLLGFVLNTDNGTIFKNLKHLIKLDISQNRIQNLQSEIFKGTTSLHYLNISNNLLRDMDFKVGHLLQLKHIDLSYNQIGYLSTGVCDSLDDLSKNNNVTLNLTGNNLACTCATKFFLKWMQSTNVRIEHFRHYSCRLSNGTIISLNALDDIIADLDIECMSKLGLIIGTAVGILLAVSIVTVGIVYRYRWKIRYLYYIARNKNLGYTVSGEEDSGRIFEYDAFVSYADEDRNFVISEMIRNLEQNHNLRLCIHQRDFVPGLDIAENITNAIHNSRKTVVIMSYNFLKSYWCKFEFNMARMEAIYSRDGSDILFLIFLRHVSAKDMPLMIMDLVDSQSYIEYPDDPHGNVVFWEKIKTAVT